jgi:hypothetical protein
VGDEIESCSPDRCAWGGGGIRASVWTRRYCDRADFGDSGHHLRPNSDSDNHCNQTSDGTQNQCDVSAPGLLSEIDLEFNPPKSVGLAPSHLIQYFAAMPSAQSGTVVIQNPDQAFGLYSEPGDWQLDNVQIDDNTGHSVSYDKAKLAKLFPSLSLRVVNTGPVDFRGPNIVSGQILTPTVSNTGSSTSLFANVSVTDNLSGAYDVSMLLIPPAGAYYYAYGSPAAPILSGTITAGANLPSAPTGT